MAAIVFIAGIIAFVYLNNRISRIENELKGRQHMAPAPAAPVAMPQAATLPAQTPVPQVAHAAFAPKSSGFDEESGGRWLGRIGIAALFIGIAFFLKYAFDNNLIDEMGRVLLGLVAGAIFIASGQFLRAKYQQYSYLLIGGGGAILFLTLWAAFNLYHLISQPVAFGSMIVVTVIVTSLAIMDDALLLAILALLGGFGTPYLLSSGSNDPTVLFTYIAILDLAMIALGIWKNWPTLIYISFIGTIFQYYSWQSGYYTEDQLPIALTYLSLFFIIFLATPLLKKIVTSEKSKDEDLGLAAINGFLYFGATYYLLNPLHHDALWIFALILGATYFALSMLVHVMSQDDTLLRDYFIGIATIFVTIAIPLKLEHSWITLAWLLEAALLYAIAFAYQRHNLQLFGAVVYIVAIVRLFWTYIEHYSNSTPFWNEYVGLFALAIVLSYAIAYMYSKMPQEVLGSSNTSLAGLFFVVANILTIYVATSQISIFYDQEARALFGGSYGGETDIANQKNTVISIVWTIYSVVLIAIGFAAKSRIARMFGLIFFFITALKIFYDVWSMGELYRIVASIVFGAIALLASFMYVKYSQRIKDIVLRP
jgi:uncharacterized membrane protein